MYLVQQHTDGGGMPDDFALAVVPHVVPAVVVAIAVHPLHAEALTGYHRSLCGRVGGWHESAQPRQTRALLLLVLTSQPGHRVLVSEQCLHVASVGCFLVGAAVQVYAIDQIVLIDLQSRAKQSRAEQSIA